MSKSLSNISSEATEEQNTPGILSPILRIEPDDGLALVLQNNVNVGDEAGIPVAANLENSDGEDLPIETDLALGFRQPGDDDFTVVSEVKSDIEVFNLLSLTEQRETDKIDATKIKLKGGARQLIVGENDELLVLAEGPEQIDFDNSRLSLNENAVTEVSMDALN